MLVTGNGPVVVGGPDVHPALSLRTASYVTGELGFDSLLPLLRARTAADVEAALGRWVEPVNNLVVADVHGDVRQRVVGLVPDRPDENRWRPVPATDARARWTGWVTDLPHRSVPPGGHLVTANHRMDDSFDPVGVEFAAPARADRIDALLTGRDRLTLDDFAAIHRDDLAARPAALLAALVGLRGLSGGGEALRRELEAWDQHLGADSTTAAAYVRVRDLLVARLAADEPFAALTDGCPFDPLYDPWFLVAHQLSLSLPNLLSPRGRRLVPGLEQHLVAAVEQAAGEERHRYGDRHRFEPPHPLGHRLPDPPGLVQLHQRVVAADDQNRCAARNRLVEQVVETPFQLLVLPQCVQLLLQCCALAFEAVAAGARRFEFLAQCIDGIVLYQQRRVLHQQRRPQVQARSHQIDGDRIDLPLRPCGTSRASRFMSAIDEPVVRVPRRRAFGGPR